MDARRVILEFRPAINQWPLQLYFSVLLFAPQESVIRQKFALERPKELLPPKTDTHWAGCLQSLDEHESEMRAVALSRDSQILATADASILKLWHVSSGVCTSTIRLPEGSDVIGDLLFSKDSNSIYATIGLGPELHTLTVWDVYTGSEMAKYRVRLTTESSAPDEEHVLCLSLPNNLKQALVHPISRPALFLLSTLEHWSEASRADPKIDLWGPLLFPPRTSSYRFRTLPFLRRPVRLHKYNWPDVLLSRSPCLEIYAIQTCEGHVWLRNIETSKNIRVLGSKLDKIVASRFSERTKALLAVTNLGLVRLWDVVSGRQRKIWKVHLESSATNRICVSQDLTVLAFEQFEDTIKAFDSPMGLLKRSSAEAIYDAPRSEAEHALEREGGACEPSQFPRRLPQTLWMIWRTETSNRVSKVEEVE